MLAVFINIVIAILTDVISYQLCQWINRRHKRGEK